MDRTRPDLANSDRTALRAQPGNSAERGPPVERLTAGQVPPVLGRRLSLPSQADLPRVAQRLGRTQPSPGPRVACPELHASRVRSMNASSSEACCGRQLVQPDAVLGRQVAELLGGQPAHLEQPVRRRLDGHAACRGRQSLPALPAAGCGRGRIAPSCPR